MIGIRGLSLSGERSRLTRAALVALNKFGTDAHVWIPGIGYFNGLQAGNYIDSAGTQAGLVDNPVGRANDAVGAITATQGTTANKPILRRGAVNLLTYSEQFDNAAWTKNNTTASANAITAPDGKNTADKLSEDAVTAAHTFQQSLVVVAGIHTVSVYIKSAERTFALFSHATTNAISVNLSTGEATSAVGSPTNIISTNVGNGWWRVSFTFTPTAGSTNINIYSSTDGVWANRSFTGTTGNGIYVWGAQLELGSTASEYIPTTTAAASSSSGDYYWQFDGSNDSLALSSVPFQMADDHCVVAGYRPISLAANADLYAQRSTASANPITLLRVSTSGAVQALHRDDAGTIQTASSTGSVAAGSSCVASMRRSSGVAIARRNGGNQSPDGTQAFGTTTFTSAAIGVSPLATPGGFSNGSIYPVIAIKGTVSDADLLVLERWVGSLSGVSVP